jgi:hypothetical protein
LAASEPEGERVLERGLRHWHARNQVVLAQGFQRINLVRMGPSAEREEGGLVGERRKPEARWQQRLLEEVELIGPLARQGDFRVQRALVVCE